jgi:hypothetical protein
MFTIRLRFRAAVLVLQTRTAARQATCRSCADESAAAVADYGTDAVSLQDVTFASKLQTGKVSRQEVIKTIQ